MTEKNWHFKDSLKLFLVIFKVGFFTFGGGWSIVAQFQKEMVEKYHWITEEELLDYTSMSRSFPGLMIANMVVMIGTHLGGPLCAVIAAIAVSLPSVILLTVITYFYDIIKDNLYVVHALAGVRATVVPIIFLAALKLYKSACIDKFTLALMIVILALCIFTSINNAILVLAGAGIGLIVKGVRSNAPSN